MHSLERIFGLATVLMNEPGSGERERLGADSTSALDALPALADGRTPLIKTFFQRTRGAQAAAAAAEFQAAGRLAGLGVPVAEPLQAPAAGDAQPRLLFFAPPRSIPLVRLLREAPAAGSGGDRAAALAAAKAALRAVAAAHAAGVRMPELRAWCVLILPGGAPLLAGPGKASFRAHGFRSAARDVAALFATIPAGDLSRAGRLRLVRAYREVRAAPLACGSERRVWRRLALEEQCLRRGGVLPSPAGLRAVGPGPDRIEAVEPAWSPLRAAGFGALQSFVAPRHPGAVFLREREGRRNIRLELPGGRYFLKAHAPVAAAQALQEWRNNLALLRHGISGAVLAAWGRGAAGAFFASRDDGGVPLDDVLRDAGACDPARRRALAQETGRLVARLHAARLFHRDLYLCHILATPSTLILIDVQRLVEAPLLWRRRRVKDLAALLYSSLATPATHCDRLRFYLEYAGRRTLTRADHRLIRAAARKARRIAAHAGPPRAPGPGGQP